MKPLPLEEIKQIVVFRSDHIGDLLLSTPFIKALREGMPEAKLTVCVPEYTAEVLRGSSFVDEILSYQPGKERRTAEMLRARGLDLAVSLAPRSQSYKMAFRSGARFRVGYVYASRPLTQLMCHVWLTHVMVVNLEGELALGHCLPHEVQQLGELAKAMGLPYGDDSLSMAISREGLQFGESLTAGWKRPLTVLQLHNNWLTCGWSVNNLARLVEGLLWSVKGGGVIVVYGPAERELAEALHNELECTGLMPGGRGFDKNQSISQHNAPITFVGDLPLQKWGGVFAASDFVVSPDTGAVHLAAVLHKPVVAVYEPKTAALNMQQWAPWQVPHRAVVKSTPEETMPQIFQGVEEFQRVYESEAVSAREEGRKEVSSK